MRQIKEVLRLKAAGLSLREIERSTGAARTTVHEYIVRAACAGLSWPLPEGLGDQALEEALFPPLTAELARRRPVPDWAEVHRELRAGRHVTLRLIWLEWRAANPDGLGYTQFCAHYRAWLATKDVVMRLNFAPGARMFVDYAGDKVPVSGKDGETYQAEVFVATLGYERLPRRAGHPGPRRGPRGARHEGRHRSRRAAAGAGRHFPGPDAMVVCRTAGGDIAFLAHHMPYVVAWRGFKGTVRTEARASFFSVRLWEATQVLEALFEAYDRLPSGIRSQLPLQRTWTLVTPVEA